jgi:hypothetical protein
MKELAIKISGMPAFADLQQFCDGKVQPCKGCYLLRNKKSYFCAIKRLNL